LVVPPRAPGSAKLDDKGKQIWRKRDMVFILGDVDRPVDPPRAAGSVSWTVGRGNADARPVPGRASSDPAGNRRRER